MKSTFDCIVIGSGIAGMTAAIYLKRANVDVLLLDNSSPGGVLNKVRIIENYPGYINISGPDLAYKVFEQVNNLNINVTYGKVMDIEDHYVITDIGKYEAKYIIIATGRQATKINNLNLENMSYCVLCDANLYKDKVVALITDDNIQDVDYLSSICKKVILVSNKITVDKANIINSKVLNNLVIADNKVNSIIADEEEHPIDGVFVSLGYTPASDFLKNIKTENGYVLVDSNMQTNIDYVYACGDVIKKNVYQVTTAVGEAATAAISVKNRLKSN